MFLRHIYSPFNCKARAPAFIRTNIRSHYNIICRFYHTHFNDKTEFVKGHAEVTGTGGAKQRL
ncbi:hypothetical protein B4100_3495 [Heyndrickxia coagulans]|nr:hypothetical protein B4100_3495 [Heyndrickxia coagulans]